MALLGVRLWLARYISFPWRYPGNTYAWHLDRCFTPSNTTTREPVNVYVLGFAIRDLLQQPRERWNSQNLSGLPRSQPTPISLSPVSFTPYTSLAGCSVWCAYSCSNDRVQANCYRARRSREGAWVSGWGRFDASSGEVGDFLVSQGKLFYKYMLETIG